MHAFLALIRDTANPASNAACDMLREAVFRHLSVDHPDLVMPGCDLFDMGGARPPNTCLTLPQTDGIPCGLIYGALFRNGDIGSTRRQLGQVGAAEASDLIRSHGCSLMKDYWGSYIAFLKCGEDFCILTDPTCAIPCFYTNHCGVTVVFSHLEKCPPLIRRGLTVNYRFLSALVAYDKIANGETGFNEIHELPGGMRLRIGHEVLTTDTLWDPRQVAQDTLEPGRQEAASLLRETTGHVVLSRATGFDTITVNLSGGLDSSIVLSCLRGGKFTGHLKAVHHVVDSGDPSELSYARAVAAAAGCELLEMHFQPDESLPDPEAHPLSVRPWRQFLSTAPLDGYAAGVSPGRHGVFTGQGGDHLFHVTETPHGACDYIRQHGLGRHIGRELISSARLSGRSVWSVGADTLRNLLRAPNESEMVRTFNRNRMALNAPTKDQPTPADCLPDWAIRPGPLPPAKFDQVSALLHMMMIREPLDRPVLRDFVHPLISQPLIELCLRLPVYVLCQPGISRGLAREAFAGIIPDLVRLRMTKGETTRFHVAGAQANLTKIRETLLEGELVSCGLIPRQALSEFADHDRLHRSPLGRRLRVMYVIESWLRSWRAELNRQGEVA